MDKINFTFISLLMSALLLSCVSNKTAQVNSNATSTDVKHNGALFDSVITEKYWKLIELRGQKVLAVEGRNREEHFILKRENNRVIGHGGCNSFTGTYELLNDNRIKFSRLASTMMACSNAAYEQEFLRILETVDNYTLRADTLSLNKARMAPLARFQVVYFK